MIRREVAAVADFLERKFDIALLGVALVVVGGSALSGYLVSNGDYAAAAAVVWFFLLVVVWLEAPIALVAFAALAMIAGQSSAEKVKLLFDMGRWIPLIVLGTVGSLLALRTERVWRRSHLIPAAFITYAALSALYSVAPSVTLLRAGSLVVMLLATFVAIPTLSERTSTHTIVRALAMVGAAACATSLILAGVGGTLLHERIAGVFENPNSLGLYSAIHLPLLAALATESPRRTWWWRVAFLIALTALVLSGSRGGAIAAVAGLLWLFTRKRDSTSKSSRLVLTFLVILAVALIALAIRPSIELIAGLYSRPRPNFMSDRLSLWRHSIDLIAAKPVLGHGFGTEDVLLRSAGLSARGWYAGNAFIGLTLQLGLIGSVFLFGGLFLLIVKNGRRVKPESGRASPTQAALVGVLIAGLVACGSESWIYSMGNSQAFSFWSCVGLLAARHVWRVGGGSAYDS